MKNPAVVDEKNPRLSWINSAKSNKRGQWQSAYQIKVATSAESLKILICGIAVRSYWKAEWIGAPWQGEEAIPKPKGGPNERTKILLSTDRNQLSITSPIPIPSSRLLPHITQNSPLFWD